MIRTLKLVLLLLALGTAAYFVERWIVTDGEEVGAVVEQGVEAVREGDLPGLRRLLAESYRGEGKSADGAVKRIGALWKTFRPGGLRAEVLEVTVEGDEASAPVNAHVTIAGRPVVVALDVGFVREEGGWKIRSAVPKDVAQFGIPFLK